MNVKMLGCVAIAMFVSTLTTPTASTTLGIGQCSVSSDLHQLATTHSGKCQTPQGSVRPVPIPLTQPERPLHADPAWRDAVRVLVTLDEGVALLDSLAMGGVRLARSPQPLGDAWAGYAPRQRTIWLDPSLVSADPCTLAALLAHEATHAVRDLDGTFATDVETWGAAAQAGLWVWLSLYGPNGAPVVHHPYEQVMNDDLAFWLEDPAGYLDTFTAADCAPADRSIPLLPRRFHQ